MLIIFDSSVLFGYGFDSPNFDLLRMLKQSGEHRVAIPWMVQEELVAQKTLGHAEAYKKAVSAISALNKIASWDRQRQPQPFDVERVRDHWREQYQNLFEVIETSGATARVALFREASCEKPANSVEAKGKGGARDAAIWLSVVDYLNNHADGDVCFVSNNTSDFGDGSSYYPPMSKDIEGLEERLKHLTSFDAVVSTFSKPIEIDEKYIESILVKLLTSQDALALLEKAAQEFLTSKLGSWAGNEVQGSFAGLRTSTTYAPVRWTSWVGTPTAVLRRVSGASGHEIGSEKWYTATVDWVLVGFAIRPLSPGLATASSILPAGFSQTACQWRTKLLFSAESEKAPTLLQYGAAEALNPDEKAEWEPLLQKTLPPFSSSPWAGASLPASGSWAWVAASLLAMWASKIAQTEISESDVELSE